MSSKETIIKNIERMDRLINEYNLKLDSLDPTEEVLDLKEKIERYNNYKTDFMYPKKGTSKIVSNNGFTKALQDFQDNISGEILICFMSKKEN